MKEENPLAAHGVSEVALLAWRQNCVRCHGIIGRGDGPQAAIYQPPDLTNPERQKQLTDADLTLVIQNGRGKMPGFKLPAPTLEGLVTLIRLLDASGKLRAPAGSAAAPGSVPAPPAASGPPSPAPTATPPAGARPPTSPTPSAQPNAPADSSPVNAPAPGASAQ